MEPSTKMLSHKIFHYMVYIYLFVSLFLILLLFGLVVKVIIIHIIYIYTLLMSMQDTQPVEGPPTPGQRDVGRESYRKSVADYFQLVKSLPMTSIRTRPHLLTTAEGGDPPGSGMAVLERTVSEQHQVITLLHQMNTSLEDENKLFCDRINKQEKELADLKDRLHLRTDTDHPTRSATETYKKLEIKNEEIAQLKQYVNQLEQGSSEGAEIELFRQQLSKERSQNSVLREQLSRKKEELSHVNEELLNRQSKLIGSETRVNALKEDLNGLREQIAQYKESIMSLRTSLVERDSQLSELSKAWMEEKRSSSALRETQNKLLDEVETLRSRLEASSTADIPSNFPLLETEQKKVDINSPSIMGRFVSLRVPLFDQVSKRTVLALELERKKDQKLGIKYRLLEAPVSLKGSSLIISSVREGSISHGLLLPGDEVLEVNGFMCRGPLQDEAMKCLKQVSGRLKVVVARECLADKYDGHMTSTVPVRLAPDGEPRHHLTSTQSPLVSDEDTVGPMSPGGTPLLPSGVSPSPTPSPDHELYLPRSSSPLDSSGDSVSSLILRELQESPLDRVLEEEEEDQEEEDHNYSIYHQSVLQPEDLGEEEDHYLQVLRLQADAVDKDSKIGELETTVQTQDVTIKKLTGNSNRLHIELDKAGSEIRHLQELVNILEQKSSSLRHDHTAVEGEKETLRNRVLAIEEELALAQARVSDLQEQLVGRDEDFFELTEESVQLADNCDAYKEEIEELKKTNQQLTDTVSRLDTQILELSRERESEDSVAKEGLTALQKELNDTKSLLEVRAKEAESLQATLEEERNVFEQKLSEAMHRMDTLASELVATQDVSVVKQSASEQVKSELEEAEVRVADLQSKLTACSLREGELCGELDALRSANSGLEQIAQQMEDEVDRYQSNLALVKERKKELEEQVANLEALVGGLRSSMEEVTGKLKETVNDRETQQNKTVRLEREAIAFKTTEEQLKRKVSSLEEDNVLLSSRVEQLNLTIAEQEEVKKKSEEDSAVAKEKITSLETALVQLQGDLAGSTERELLAQQHLQKLRKTHKEMEMSNTVRLESLEAENNSLTSQLAEVKKGMKELRDFSGGESKRATSEITRLETELESLRKRLLSIDRELITSSQERESLKAELKKAHQLASSYEDERDALQHTVDLLKESLSQSEQTWKEKEDAAASVVKELSGVKSANVSLKQEVETLKQTMETQSEELSELKASLLKHEDEMMGAQLQLGQASRSLEETERQLMAERKKVEEICTELSSVRMQASQLQTISERVKADLHSSEASVKRLEDTVRSTEFLMNQEVSKSLQFENQLKQRTEELSTVQTSWEAYQRETSSKIKTLSAENTALKDNVDMMKVELQAAQEDQEGTGRRLKNELEELQSRYKSAFDEVTSHNKASVRNQAVIDNLNIDLKAAHEETATIKSKLSLISEEKESLSKELGKARNELQLLQDKMAAEDVAKANLSSELVRVQNTLKTKNNKMGELTLELSALQTTCTMNRQLLESTEKDNEQLKQELANVSKVKASLEVSQKELESQLKVVRSDLSARCDVVEQLRASLAIAEELRIEKDSEYKSLEKKLFSSESGKSELVSKLRSLERTNEENRVKIEQLVSGQLALKETLTARGDQRETEVMKLQDQITELENSLTSLKSDKESLLGKEKNLTSLVDSLEKERQELVTTLHKQKEQQLKLRYEHVKEASALQEGFDSKERKLKEVTQQNRELQDVVKDKTTELNNVQEELASLVSLKVMLADRQSLEDTLRKEIKSLKSQNALLDQEQSRVLGLLRKYEVEASTRDVPPPPTPKQAKSATKDQLRAMLKERDEEVVRLREYVQKLLEKVVERAPHLLEAMHK